MANAQSYLTRHKAIGVHCGDKVFPEAARETFPGVTHTRPFSHKKPNAYLGDPQGDNLVERVVRVCAPSRKAGIVPVYSFKLHPGQVAKGQWDGQVREVAASHVGEKTAQVVL